MPIPEPAAYLPAKLITPPGITAKQAKQDQLAAIYGVNMANQQLTETDYAQMRNMLSQHDSQSKKMTIHDLNNPPREQYRFQKFPMMVYDLTHSYPSRNEQRPKANSLGMETVHMPAKVVSRTVNSDEELEEALNAGWSQQAPAFTEEREEPLNASYAGEAARIDEQIEEQRVKRTYNRKTA
jgi:hypothetical protein